MRVVAFRTGHFTDFLVCFCLKEATAVVAAETKILTAICKEAFLS